MTVIATLDLNEYFSRNDKVAHYIKSFNDAYPQAGNIESRLISAVNFVKQLKLDRGSRWFNKANLFTLLIELDKTDTSKIKIEKLVTSLESLDRRALLTEFGLEKEQDKLSLDEQKYLDFAREAVNQRAAREFRGQFMRNLFQASS
jgi:hypothetical protein